MGSTGWSTGVSIRLKCLATHSILIIAYSQVARDQINLFPVVVDEGLTGINARFETKEACATSTFPIFV
jgi:hypothetical protein